MTQVTHDKTQGRGNTKPALTSRTRNYCFTLNNYTPENIKNFCGIDCSYVFQEETGAKGTKHLQGILMFKNARSFKSVKDIEPKAHWEPTKDKEASILYCSKEDTRTGQIFTNIDLQKFIRRDLTQHKQHNMIQKISNDDIVKKNLEEFRKKLYNGDFDEEISQYNY